MAWDDLLDIVDGAIVATTGVLQWGESVSYRSFGDGTVTLNATRDTINVEYEDQGVWVRDRQLIWMIRAGDLVSDGTALTPKRKDTIVAGSDTFDYVSHTLDADGTFYSISMQKADL